MFFTAIGVFLLACGASALNQVQERDIDALMERTHCRPLPAGLMSQRQAIIASFTTMVVGLFLLGRSGRLPFLIGVLAVLWYNGFYTWLKRRTAFAAVYGAPVGMAAPAIGWTAGGGSITDPRLAVVAMLFFLWQVPHFWLLLLRSGDDYERAGLPSLTKVFPRKILSGIIVLWLIAAAAASMLLPLFGMVRTPLLYGLLVLSVVLSSAGTSLLLMKPSFPKAAFPLINLFLAALLVFISADALLVR
jgi:protoheme IX farnesyltransferase